MIDERKSQNELTALKDIRLLAERTNRTLAEIAAALGDDEAMRRIVAHGVMYFQSLLDSNCPIHGANCPRSHSE